ncbi:DMT family transporter [Pelagibacterales bacterium]|nr:DMT family transporter [Pelagibacterales bacterium]MDB9817861.1 DMT family transporter [Pelagibacterales bacterium]
MTRFFPIVFIILWSSAFITSKPITVDASPFAALCFRFTFVTIGFALFSIITNQKLFTDFNKILKAMISGILFHGLYLGGVFYSISKGFPVGITALIVCLQPILTAILAGPLLNEVVTWRQWIGIILGFLGTLIVLGFDGGKELPVVGIVASFIALAAVTAGTLWQKTLSEDLPLSVSNTYQAFSASCFHLIVALALGDWFINLTLGFVLSMGWQILAVSFGAFTILMYLIKNDSASKTATLFFLVPPVSVFMAWIFINENITIADFIGLLIATLGVYIATRKQDALN